MDLIHLSTWPLAVCLPFLPNFLWNVLQMLPCCNIWTSLSLYVHIYTHIQSKVCIPWQHLLPGAFGRFLYSLLWCVLRIEKKNTAVYLTSPNNHEWNKRFVFILHHYFPRKKKKKTEFHSIYIYKVYFQGHTCTLRYVQMLPYIISLSIHMYCMCIHAYM